MDVEALLLTLRLATVTTGILLLIAIPISYLLAFSRRSWRFVVEAAVALPLVLPPTVLGFYLLVALGPLTGPGRWLSRALGHTLAFSFQGLVLGSVLYSLPFAVQPLVAGLRAVEPRYMETAATLGVSPWRSFLRVALPLSRSSLLAAAVLTFTHTIGEFGVVRMLGGSLPGTTRTVSIAIFDLAENGDFAEANRMSLILLAISTAALLVLYVRPRAGREREL